MTRPVRLLFCRPTSSSGAGSAAAGSGSSFLGLFRFWEPSGPGHATTNCFPPLLWPVQCSVLAVHSLLAAWGILLGPV